jgi:hypothetical protein
MRSLRCRRRLFDRRTFFNEFTLRLPPGKAQAV